ncbi:MAG: NAD+ synthase [Deltaproteobacteria bacterium]|nr:NAD+ synthase [Deltaproteobacteria bacterium]
MKLAIVQDDATVGAIPAIRRRMLARVDDARAAGADLVIFPELSTVGYPPKDLLDLPGFVAANLQTVEALAPASRDIAILLGHVEPNPSPTGKPLFNSASLLVDGRVARTWHKALLPCYDVFDDPRYFAPGTASPVASLGGRTLGVTICEDIWTASEATGRPLYDRDPAGEQLAQGADLLINLSASPWSMDKLAVRRGLVARLARRGGVPVVYANQVGANDELLFDGASFIVDAKGRLVAQARQFAPDLLVFTLDDQPAAAVPEPAEGTPALLAALEMGLRDYLRKTGFRDVVLGLSGGIDSAVVAAIAARALGPDHVTGLLMPSPWSSDHSVADARALAEALGIRHHVLPIGDAMAAYDRVLAPVFADTTPGLAEENLQARIRGNLVMAWANKYEALALCTGNKSEMAVGYCTLYGDMAGALSLIADVPKMMVYELAHLLNAQGRVIPESSVVKPPSAELRPGQLDTDSLPPYPVLDDIIEAYVEEHLDDDDIVRRGHARATVERVIALIHRAEYKRRQAAPTLKVTSKAFGVGRRYPIVHERP